MSIDTTAEKIDEILTRGVEDIYPKPEMLKSYLKSGKKMRLYVGIDPTGKSLHIGHAMQFRKMKLFQDLGHEVILLIGSFTGMIGDPTDKTSVRIQLTKKQVLENAATYKKQAGKFLSFSGKNAVKIMFNHKWLAKMTMSDVVDLASHFTVQQMLERDMFANRIKQEKPVYLHEFLYPLMQGYDSVAMDVDLEIGGSDQMFNMLAGRTLMKAMKNKEKMVMTLKLLTNDEGKKMSKSEGGFIALDNSAEDVYGKIMAMDDLMILSYFELATDLSMDEIEGMRIQLKKGINPRDLKARLAHLLVEMLYSLKEADLAEKNFKIIFQDHKMPENIAEFKLVETTNIIDVLVATGLTSSKTEARRLIDQNAIKIDEVIVDNQQLTIVGTKQGVVLQRGKRRFMRLIE